MRSIVPAVKRHLIIPLSLAALIVLGLAFGMYHAITLPGCVSCHDSGDFGQQTVASAHASVTCVSCHVPSGVTGRLAFGFRQAHHMVLPIVSGDGREWSAVPDVRCNTCHDAVQAATVTANGIRISHALCTEGAECTSCHGTTAHGDATSWVRTYDMETCLACHVSQGAAECDLCHEGRRPANRVTTGVFAITHGAQWESTHGMGDSATCVACHTAASCEKCHGVGLPHGARYIDRHASDALKPAARCDSCHEPVFCSGCHGLEMPHPMTFTRNHAEESRQDAALCDRCHAEPDCTRCHETHVHPGGAIGALGTGGGGD